MLAETRSRLRWLAFIFFTFYSSVVLAQEVTIHGTVKHEQAPLQGATISIGTKSTVTDSAGNFSITISAGKYTLLVTHVGYKKIEQPFILNSGETKSFQFDMMRDEQINEAVILGSRSFIRRSNLNTVAPVDEISSKELKQTGQASLVQMLNFTTPSFNTSRQNLFEPVTLRALSPDHVLILVNGTRYHSLALINTGAIRGILGKGAVMNDLNSIPFSAIEKIEILRDGASAQYGSDAIAGVINIKLKQATERASINLHLGQYYKGDGENLVFGANYGLHLNKKGYLNFSGDFRHREPTDRGGNYTGTVYSNNKAVDDSIIAARGFNRKNAVSNVGIILSNSAGFLMNGEYPVSGKIKMHWTGGVNYQQAVYPGAYRFPKNGNQVNTILYPDGFKVKAIVNRWDISGIVGSRGTMKGWNWEWNSSYGKNTNTMEAKNTNNASQFSLGNQASSRFYAGRPAVIQQTNTIGVAKDFAKQRGFLKTFNVGFGAEYRFEKFYTREGDTASWKNYDSTGKTQGGVQGVTPVSPADVVSANRSVTGVYLDLETDINDRLLVNTSGRYEHYNDFDNNLAGKLALHYKFAPAFALRFSLSNGFHAPALQQIYFGSTSTTWKNVGGVNTPVALGIFRNNSDVAKAFGVKPLQPEKALNLAAGFTSRFSSHITMTVDGYWIQIKNRIVLSGRFDKAGNNYVKKILENYSQVDQVQFITNAINTKNLGLDIVLNGNWKIKKGNLACMLAANFNSTKIFGAIQTTDKLPADSLNTNTLFNREEKMKIEKGQPRSKIIVYGTYSTGRTTFLIRNTRFGKTAYAFDSKDLSRDQSFSAKILTDLAIEYTLKKELAIKAGGNNVFNVYPDRLKNYTNTTEGILIYSNESSPFGFNGGYYYVGITFNY